MNDVVIKSVRCERGGRRLVYEVQTKKGTNELWFEVESEYAEYLVTDRCDSALVLLVPLALREGYERIVSEVPVSAELAHSLRKHVVPQLAAAVGVPAIRIETPETETTFDADAVAAGMSLGIDSFATLAEYGRGEGIRALTHLTFFNVGAHHGYDWRVGRSKQSSRELFDG